ncbi:uncharacterized protein LOC131947072 isoform X2 [Physella acuta]|uniref:uncharacterized protein LOC131947072 isoform X2 n=1 Tax=Physella acuta TaxID=109671 RepID=UPI0027DD0E7C|nr:uncharacterized protein LOC131947072 isoform X2 [Physella acuta]
MAYFTLTITCLLWAYGNVCAVSVVNPPTPGEGMPYTLTCDGVIAPPWDQNSTLMELRLEASPAARQTNILALFRLVPEVIKTQNIPTGNSPRNWSYVFTGENASKAMSDDVMKVEIHVHSASSSDSANVCCIALYDVNDTRGSINVTQCQQLTVGSSSDNKNITAKKESNTSDPSVLPESHGNPFGTSETDYEYEDEDDELHALPVIGEQIVTASPVPILGVVYAVLFFLVVILLVWWHCSPPRDHVRQPSPKPDHVTKSPSPPQDHEPQPSPKPEPVT